MKNILIVIGCFFLLLLESVLTYRLGIKGIRPDFVFIIVFLLAFHRPIDQSMLMVWIIGLLKDIVSQSGFGTTAFLYLICAILISLARQIVFKEDTLIQMVVLFGSVWLCNTLNGLGVFLSYVWPAPIGYIIMKSLYISVYTTIMAGIILIIYGQIKTYLRLRSVRY